MCSSWLLDVRRPDAEAVPVLRRYLPLSRSGFDADRLASAAACFALGRLACGLRGGLSPLCLSASSVLSRRTSVVIAVPIAARLAIATTFSSDEPDMLRGPQFHKAAGDEFASWRYPEALDNLILGLRLGSNPQLALATTPKPVRHLRELLAQPGVVVTRGSTYENLHNLAPGFRDVVLRRYEGTRLGRQEIYAELLTDTPGALWKRETIDRFRVRIAPTEFVRVVVAIDPMSGGLGEHPRETDDEVGETGIVVVGLATNGHGYVLEDCSVRGDPETWGRAAVAAYQRYEADRIVAEVNNGGEMVGYVVATLDPRVNFQPVWASRGKQARAEPVSALYVQGLAHHVGVFPELEDELTTWVPGLTASPNRLDACVWALTAFFYTDEEAIDVYALIAEENRVRISPI